MSGQCASWCSESEVRGVSQAPEKQILRVAQDDKSWGGASDGKAGPSTAFGRKIGQTSLRMTRLIVVQTPITRHNIHPDHSPTLRVNSLQCFSAFLPDLAEPGRWTGAGSRERPGC